jgi:hypothetical protein
VWAQEAESKRVHVSSSPKTTGDAPTAGHDDPSAAQAFDAIAATRIGPTRFEHAHRAPKQNSVARFKHLRARGHNVDLQSS